MPVIGPKCMITSPFQTQGAMCSSALKVTCKIKISHEFPISYRNNLVTLSDNSRNKKVKIVYWSEKKIVISWNDKYSWA